MMRQISPSTQIEFVVGKFELTFNSSAKEGRDVGVGAKKQHRKKEGSKRDSYSPLKMKIVSVLN